MHPQEPARDKDPLLARVVVLSNLPHLFSFSDCPSTFPLLSPRRRYTKWHFSLFLESVRCHSACSACPALSSLLPLFQRFCSLPLPRARPESLLTFVVHGSPARPGQTSILDLAGSLAAPSRPSRTASTFKPPTAFVAPLFTPLRPASTLLTSSSSTLPSDPAKPRFLPPLRRLPGPPSPHERTPAHDKQSIGGNQECAGWGGEEEGEHCG